jgi:hypothetical protein
MCVPVVAALAVVGVALEAVSFKAALAEPAFVGLWLLIAH